MTDNSSPVITIELSIGEMERLVRASVRQAVNSPTFLSSAVRMAVEKKVDEWVQAYDLAAEIDAVARNVVRATVQQAVVAAVKKQTGEVLAAMISTGEFSAMVTQLVADNAVYCEATGLDIRKERKK